MPKHACTRKDYENTESSTACSDYEPDAKLMFDKIFHGQNCGKLTFAMVGKDETSEEGGKRKL